MMTQKSVALTFVLLLLTFAGFSQDKILMMKQKGKYYFEVQGKDANRLDSKKPLRSVVDILDDYPEAGELAQKAKRNYDWGLALSILGGGLVGWELGEVLWGAELNPVIFVVGTTSLLATISLAKEFKTNMNSAIKIYNNGGKEVSMNYLHIGIQDNGIGFSYNF
jgi:hypothetical protein